MMLFYFLLLILNLFTDVQSSASWCSKSPFLCISLSYESKFSTQVKFTIESPKETGYVALGIGKEVSEADIYIFWCSKKTNLAHLNYLHGLSSTTTEINSEREVEGVQILSTSCNGSETKGTQSIVFLRQFRPSHGHQDLSWNGTQRPIDLFWFYSLNPPFTSSSNQISIPQQFGKFKLNLGGSTHTPTSDTETLDIHDGTKLEEGEGEEHQTVSLLLVAHGIIMMVAWLVLPPLAIFIAKFLKLQLGHRWFQLHFGLFIGTGVLTLLGIILAALMVGNAMDDPHAIIGVTVFILFGLQVSLGIVIDKLYDPTRKSVPWYDTLHHHLGRVTFLLALTNIVLGINFFKTWHWWLAFGLILTFYIGLFTYGYFRINMMATTNNGKHTKLVSPKTHQMVEKN